MTDWSFPVNLKSPYSRLLRRKIDKSRCIILAGIVVVTSHRDSIISSQTRSLFRAHTKAGFTNQAVIPISHVIMSALHHKLSTTGKGGTP